MLQVSRLDRVSRDIAFIVLLIMLAAHDIRSISIGKDINVFWQIILRKRKVSYDYALLVVSRYSEGLTEPVGDPAAWSNELLATDTEDVDAESPLDSGGDGIDEGWARNRLSVCLA